MHMSRLLPPALLLTALLTACGGPAAAPRSSPSPPLPPEPAPSPSPILKEGYVAPELTTQTYQETYTASDEDDTVVLSVDYQFPDFSNKADALALTTIADWYGTMGADMLTASATTAQDARADYDLSDTSGIPFSPTMEELTYACTFQNEHVISFARQFYANAEGWAYPTVLRTSEQFDLTTGTKIGFSQLVTDGIAASEAAGKAFMASDAVAQLVASGLDRTQLQAAFQPEDFYLTDEGFVFWIQSGSFGPDHCPTEALVPYSALKEYLVEWIG